MVSGSTIGEVEGGKELTTEVVEKMEYLFVWRGIPGGPKFNLIEAKKGDIFRNFHNMI